MNYNNQNDSSKDWNTKQIYIEYNNNYKEDHSNRWKNRVNNNDYKMNKNFNNNNNKI